MVTERMIRAARLDRTLYTEVERDVNATSQALTVVIIVALAGGISGAIGSTLRGRPDLAIGGLIGGIVGAIVAWIIWSLVTYWVGTAIFGGVATPGEMLRCIGFANSPMVLSILGFIPCFGPLIVAVAGIWALVAGVIAVREALDVTTEKALLTAIIGFFGVIIIYGILGLFGFGLRMLF